MKNGDQFVDKVKEFKSFDKNVDGLLVEVYSLLKGNGNENNNYKLLTFSARNKLTKLVIHVNKTILGHNN